MMKTDLSTDTLIQLVREVFTEETLDPERRARIYARISSNPRAKGMELWTNPVTPFDAPSIEPSAAEGDQLWLFPDFDTPSPVNDPTMSPLLHGAHFLMFSLRRVR